MKDGETVNRRGDPLEVSSERIHSFAPICGPDARVLILGTAPSPQSLASAMYYGHPRNAFWPIIAALCGEDTPRSNDEKRALLLAHRIALWDTLASCVRPGALDGSISQATPNDVASLLAALPDVRAVFLNGGGAARYWRRWHQGVALPVSTLPSTSPANARLSPEQKRAAWEQILPWLE